MPRTPERRSEYCRGQAAQCAHSANSVALPDVKEAYLNLEQGWLQLALEFESELKSRKNSDAGIEQKDIRDRIRR